MLVLGHNSNYGDRDYPHANVREVTLSDNARKQGTYIIGTTGTGKTTLLLNLICQDMVRQGPMGYEGLCVLDPHGDFTTDILRRVPKERRDDVILFDPTDVDFPMGLNLLDCTRTDPRERDLVTSAIIDILYKLFDYSWGPRMEDLLRHSLLTLLYHPQPTTLIHLMLLLINYQHRQTLSAAAKANDPILRSYWEDQFPEAVPGEKGYWQNRRDQMELVGSSLNKIGRFIANPIIRHIVGQEQSAFNFREIMKNGQILLVNLSKGEVGPDNASLLGAVIVNQLLIAALSRRAIPEEERKPFHLYVDEYQTFATRTFPQLQSEARKYAVDTVVAHQYRDQLDDENKGSSLNVANLIVLRVSGTDATELATQYDLTPPPGEIKWEPVRYPVDEDGLVWAAEMSEGTGTPLYRTIEGPQQLYSDVHLETANLLAQLPNYEAICRILEPGERGRVPSRLRQFRITLMDKPTVKKSAADQTEAYIRKKAQERAMKRKDVEQRIADYTGSGGDEPGAIPPIPAFESQ